MSWKEDVLKVVNNFRDDLRDRLVYGTKANKNALADASGTDEGSLEGNVDEKKGMEEEASSGWSKQLKKGAVK